MAKTTPRIKPKTIDLKENSAIFVSEEMWGVNFSVINLFHDRFSFFLEGESIF